MTINADIEYFLDDENNIKNVKIKKYRIFGEYRILEDQLCLEKEKIYKLNLRNPDQYNRDKSVVLHEFVRNDIGYPLEVLVFFRESSTFGKVEITELDASS